jgi:hypothetical protein
MHRPYKWYSLKNVWKAMEHMSKPWAFYRTETSFLIRCAPYRPKLTNAFKSLSSWCALTNNCEQLNVDENIIEAFERNRMELSNLDVISGLRLPQLAKSVFFTVDCSTVADSMKFLIERSKQINIGDVTSNLWDPLAVNNAYSTSLR